jgi:predicted NBD/HSP70 family sugar kinase
LKTEHGKNDAEVMINPDIGYIVALDLVKEQVRLAVTDFAGEIREEYTGINILKTKNLWDAIVREIENIGTLYQNREKHGIPLQAVSVGVPAAADFTIGSINTVLYEILEKINIQELLTKTFNVPVFIENISNLSAIGENNCGQGKNYENIIFLEVSNGIGAGIISNNTLIRGHSGYAGEIGFSLTDKAELDSFKQRKGSLERIASVDSMVYTLKQELLFGAESIFCNDPAFVKTIDAAMLFEAALKEDTLSCRIIDRAVKHIAVCVVNLILTLDPEIVFIGGDIYHMPGVEKLLLGPLAEQVTRTIPFPPPNIQLSSLGEDAGIIGASYMAIETLLTGKYPYRIE